MLGRGFATGLLALLWLGVGCGDAGSAPKDHRSYQSVCAEDMYCDGQRCLDGRCTDGCGSNTDCGNGAADAWTCGIGADGSRVCVPPCGSAGYACIDSVSTACAVANDESSCETCGCSEDQRCEPGVGCGPKLEVGAECQSNVDCASDNCDAYNEVCRVPLGAACDAGNCQRCLRQGDWSFCTKACSYPGDCTPDTTCVQEGSLIDNYCEPKCDGFNDPACPSQCEPGSHRSSATTTLFCKCLASDGCMVLAP